MVAVTCGFIETDQLRDANLQLVVKPVARKVRRLVKSGRTAAVERLAGVVEKIVAGEAVDPLDTERGPETEDEAWVFLVLLASKYFPSDNILDDLLDRFQHGDLDLSAWKKGDDIPINEGRFIAERWIRACGDDGIPWTRFFQDDTRRGDVGDELRDLMELAFGESIAEPGADEQAGPMLVSADWRERDEPGGGDAPASDPTVDTGGVPPKKKSVRMTVAQANEKAREIARDDRTFREKPKVQKWADQIGCSTGQVTKLPYYAECARNAGTLRRGRKAKTVSFTEKLEAVTPDCGAESVMDELAEAEAERKRQREIARLEREQKADDEPSPCDDRNLPSPVVYR